MNDLKITLVQTSLLWQDIPGNLQHLETKLKGIGDETDLVLLPEMFSTGFTMDAAQYAETMDGDAVHWLSEQAEKMNCVVAGSLLIRENDRFFNRFIWMEPGGDFSYYDKRHLFRMGHEHKTMTMGVGKTIVELKGWRCSLQVCYDLRFPVWSRNQYKAGEFDYDLLIYVANWPAVRKQAYRALLPARAIENQSWVVWVNRVGKDGHGLEHSGNSAVFDPYGNETITAQDFKEVILTTTLSGQLLPEFRKKFAVGLDWDNFK